MSGGGAGTSKEREEREPEVGFMERHGFKRMPKEERAARVVPAAFDTVEERRASYERAKAAVAASYRPVAPHPDNPPQNLDFEPANPSLGHPDNPEPPEGNDQ